MKLAVFIIPFFWLQATALQAAECLPWKTDYQDKTNLKIGKIIVNTNDVFDLDNPKEKTIAHKLVNKLHLQTKPYVIRKQLLFVSGDPFQFRKLSETERKLRSRRYIKSAEVRPLEVCGNQVTIEVSTRDNWSLTPSLSFSRSGGNNRSGIAIKEHNLFGLGKSLSLNYKKGVERSSKFLSFEDYQLLGTRKTLLLGYQDNSDGKGYDLDLSLPFYELDSKKSWGISAHNLRQENTLYEATEKQNVITIRENKYSVFYGWSAHRKENSVTRFKVGWTADKTDYLKADKAIANLPHRIRESYPWVELTKLEENYIEKTNFKTMGKIEDISLGKRITLGAGLLLKGFASDSNQIRLMGRYSNGIEISKNKLGFITLDASSYLGKGYLQGETVSIKGELDHFNLKGNDLRFAASFHFSNNQKPEEQFLLGGDTGLRGYPRAFQTGNKLALLQAEKRFHFDWYPLHLAKFGAVMFADAGTAWGNGKKARILADVGIGLRMIPTRSSSSKTLHLDLAFPLLDRKKADSVYFVIKTSQSF